MALAGGFKVFANSNFEKHYIGSAYASDFYGVKYSVIYLPIKHRNMYALLSPFPVNGWVLILSVGGLVANILWISNVKFNPVFWLFTVLLEQNDDKSSEINKVDAVIVLGWLFTALMLRNAYTSNLYAYMATQLNPSDLPASLDEAVKSRSVVILSNSLVSILIQEYKKAVNHRAYDLQQTKIYHLANEIERKHIAMHSYLGPFENIRVKNQGMYELCDLKILSARCEKLDRFAYVYTSGPKDILFTTFFLVSKLLLTIDNINLQIFENNEMEYFQSGRSLSINSDNFLRFKFEKYLASVVESGISSFLMKRIDEYTIKNYVKYLKLNNGNFSWLNISDKNLLIYTMRWMQNGCFTYYSKEKCDLKINQHIEVPVKILDLIVVWLLFSVFLLMSLLAFAYEHAPNWFKRWSLYKLCPYISSGGNQISLHFHKLCWVVS